MTNENLAIKVLTQSFIDGSEKSFTFTEYILLVDSANFVEDDQLKNEDELIEQIKNKVEDEYINAENKLVNTKFIKIIDSEEFYAELVADDVVIAMQYYYMFDEPLTIKQFLEKYEIGSDIE